MRVGWEAAARVAGALQEQQEARKDSAGPEALWKAGGKKGGCRLGRCLGRCHRAHIKGGHILPVALTTVAIALMPTTPMKFEISGKVQGVFFRKYTQAKAQELQIRGWCENTKAGTVRGEAYSEDAAALESFKQWLAKTGSPKSKITGSTFKDAPDLDPQTLPKPFAIKK